MNQENIRYERLLEETRELLTKKLEKSNQRNQKAKKKFLQDFKQNITNDKTQFQKMKQENQKARMVRFLKPQK
jgi:hypothetical protein